MDKKKEEHEGKHQVIGWDPFPEEGAGTGIDLATRVPTGQAGEPEQQGVERQREDKRDDTRKDDPERAPYSNVAEQPADQRSGERRQQDASHDRQSHVVGEDGCTEAADAGQGPNAQEQLSCTAEDYIEPNGIAGKGQPENGDTHEDARVA